MGTTDANGIYFYEDTDNVSPLHTLLNLGQQSTTGAVTALKATRVRSMTGSRAAGADASFTGANTALAAVVWTAAPAGTYRITGRNALYSVTGADGFLFVEVGGVYEKARWTLPGTSLPVSPEVSMTVVHPGGNLTANTGYDRASGTAWVISAGTMVRAEFLGT